MARRFFESLDCWPNLEGDRPSIAVTLKTLEGEEAVHKEPMPVDTGFAGAMMVPRELFACFEKAELPESESHVYRTLIGPVTMRTARALLSVSTVEETEILIDSPRFGVGRSLVGSRVLKNVELLLSGRRSETCLLKERSRT